MNHSTRKPNKAEQRRLDALSRLPCCCCVFEGVEQPNRTEIHHLVDKGSRKLSGGHMATIPLCGWHHRSALPVHPQRKLATAAAMYGPSLALEKRKFVERYGTERSLLARVNRLLES